jgi:N-acetylglutamate synthase-like GNAT family acetyltransferase
MLEQAALPTGDLVGTDGVQFWVAEADGRRVGAVGLERHGDDGLLRSLVVDPASRNQGMGTLLVEALEDAARSAGVRRLFLLTQTAQEFFEHRRYVVVKRDEAPESVRASAEFRSLCPASAACMLRSLSNAGTDPGRG